MQIELIKKLKVVDLHFEWKDNFKKYRIMPLGQSQETAARIQ